MKKHPASAETAMRWSVWKWVLLGFFLTAMGVVQFIPA